MNLSDVNEINAINPKVIPLLRTTFGSEKLTDSSLFWKKNDWGTIEIVYPSDMLFDHEMITLVKEPSFAGIKVNKVSDIERSTLTLVFSKTYYKDCKN